MSLGAKTQSQKLFNVYNNILYDMKMCRWYLQDFIEIQNGCHESISFLYAQRLQVSENLNQIT